MDLSECPKWVLHMDSSSTQVGSKASLVLEGPYRMKVLYALKFGLKASNDETEYEASIT